MVALNINGPEYFYLLSGGWALSLRPGLVRTVLVVLVGAARAGKIARFGVRTRRERVWEERSVRCDAALFPQLALLGRVTLFWDPL